MPDTMIDRYSAFAGAVVTESGEVEIVVAGGQNNEVIELLEMNEVSVVSGFGQ